MRGVDESDHHRSPSADSNLAGQLRRADDVSPDLDGPRENVEHRDPNQAAASAQRVAPHDGKLTWAWRIWYERSFVRDVISGLGRVRFGDRIIVFGASLLLSVLPLIIVLSAFASHRIQDDIVHHLGLSGQGARIIEGMFTASVTSFNLAILVSLLVSFAGTLAVAHSVAAIYERAFEHPPLPGAQSLVRCLVWVACIAGVVIADAAIGKTVRSGPAGPVVIGLAEFAIFTLLFWWSIHFLLAGRESWRRLRSAAIISAVLWVALGVFAALYFSSTIVSDSKTYGSIGVTFTLATWFIAMGAVVTLGAVLGAVWQKRRDASPPKDEAGN
jgi:membrane protein